MNRISTEQAAERKRTSRQVIIAAIKRNEIDAEQIGGRYAVLDNKRFTDWMLSDRHKKAGRSRWAS